MCFQVNTVQQPSHVSLIWKCRLNAQSTGGIVFLFDARGELSVKKKEKKKRDTVGRGEGERGGVPEPPPVPKSLILTSLISIRRHRLSSIIRLNRESTFSQPSKAYRVLSSAKKKSLWKV